MPVPYPQTLPANTVWGRLGISAGPGQAIPFGDLVTRSTYSISVRDFGARADEDADDSTAINAALAAAEAAGIGTVTAPSGTYIIAATPIRMRPGVCLLGDGVGLTTIKQSDGANLQAIADFSPYAGGTLATGASLRHLTLDGNRANNTGQLVLASSEYQIVYVGNTSFITIDNCNLQNSVGFGIRGAGQVGLKVTNDRITNTEAHSIFLVDFDGDFDGDIRISDNYLGQCMLITGFNGVIISNNLIEGTLIGAVDAPMRVNVSGTAVTWVSGPTFTNAQTGQLLIADNGSVQQWVKTVNSSTSITLAATGGTHTNKLAMLGSEDLLGIGGCKRVICTGNIIRTGASFGLSLYGTDQQQLENCIFSNNYVYLVGKNGYTLLGGGSGLGGQNIIINDNMARNCCIGGAAGNPTGSGGALSSFLITGTGIDDIYLDNNFIQDDTSQTEYWLSLDGLTSKVRLGQGNFQIGAQNDGVYNPAGFTQKVVATSVTVGDDVAAAPKLSVRTDTNEDIFYLYGPSSTNVTFGFFGTTAYWQSNGGNLEIGTSTNHAIGIRTNTTVRFNVAGDGQTTVRPDVATPAAGSTSARLLFGTTAGFGIYYGSGAPTVSAGKGSIYLRSDGSSTSTRLHVNTDGGTTWTNVTTAA